MKSINQLVRPNILKLKAYSSARDEYSGGSVATLLDANENPFPSVVNRYPDPYQRELKGCIAKIKDVAQNQLFLGNGSDEAIDLIFRIFCEPGQDNVIITDPTYGMYEVSAAINATEVRKVALNEDFSLNVEQTLMAVDKNTKAILLCSPNNPTGNLLDQNAIKTIMLGFKGILVVDEAYIDFAETESISRWVNTYENLIVLQTFSKAWGMAGVRLGMAFSSSEIIALFNKVKPPYNINQLTQQYAIEQLKNIDKVEDQVRRIKKERARLKENLADMKLVDFIYPSESNFLLVKFSNANKVFNFLTREKIIVRDRSKVKFGENCLRITVGTPEENDKLINALRKL